MRSIKAISSLTAIVLLTACHAKTANSPANFITDQSGMNPQIISDRPITRDKVIMTLKLSSPSLIEAAKRTDHGLEIPKEAIANLMNEQEDIAKRLKAVSPDVQILFRYRMILNGMAFTAPSALQKAISEIPGVSEVEPSRLIGRPITQISERSLAGGKKITNTSVSFIEADRIHRELKNADGSFVLGQGMRVGVLDTGIDFTHSMLGGSGNREDFKNTNPSLASSAFPNKKVVGGLDLVGTEFNAASELWSKQLPKPDANPLDEAGHGTHVAATIAGHGDGEKTYSGVAPEASLYAIKVFGANGSTSDYVVIAGLEYAADPNQDGDPSDHLDVVNLSLGSGYGQPQILYNEAVKNLTAGGTVVVASAGNSGATDYIVGAPSTSDDALSVAASIDDMDHNWKFSAVEFKVGAESPFLVRAIEGPISKPIEKAGDVQGQLVHIGLADKDLSKETAEKLKGHIALIDRGAVPFLDKLKRAEAAGAIGAIVANNQPGEPIGMGGEGSVEIPAIMVSQDIGGKIKDGLSKTDVTVAFQTGKFIEDPKLIDTITNFSSKGPRSQDSMLKPEITAPGANIISAAFGTGTEGIQMSGTSMSGPHMAGVMTLLKQFRPTLSNNELKSVAMSTSKLIQDAKGVIYPLTLQGAGRVRAFSAALAPLAFEQPSLSLGMVQVGQNKTLRRELEIKNTTNETVEIRVKGIGQKFMTVNVAEGLSLEAGKSGKLSVFFAIKAPDTDEAITELDGAVEFVTKTAGDERTQRVPVLAMLTKISDIKPISLKVFAPTENDSADAHTELTLINNGQQPGLALPFNLIGHDRRKMQPDVTDSYRSRSCDLESAGYRIVTKELDGVKQDVLQFALKIYEPMTTWHYCEISIQIDSNSDQLADQELVGINGANVSGLGSLGFASILLDAKVARQKRLDYELKLAEGKDDEPVNYAEAVLDVQEMRAFNNSTIAMVETPLKLIGLRASGELAVKVAAIYSDTEGMSPDDFLSNQLRSWVKLNARNKEQAYYAMPESIDLAAGQTQTVALNRGSGHGKLVVYYPTNRNARTVGKESQSSDLTPSYEATATSP